MKYCGLLIIAVFLYSCGNQTGDQIWPQFRGTNSAGVASDDAKTPVKFEDKNLDWKIELPAGVSSPVIWKNKLFITAYVEDKKELQTICINRRNGKVIWQASVFPDTIERHHSVGSPAQSTVVTDGQRIISYFGSCGLNCYDMEGNILWKYYMPCNRAAYGNAASPVISGDKLILINDVGRNRSLIALDKFTGKVMWKTGFQAIDIPNVGGDATPVIFKDLIVVHRVGELSAYSVADGSNKWSYPLLTQGTSTPIIADNKIVAACWYNSTEEGQREKLPDFDELLQKYDSDKNRKISRKEFPSDLKLYTRPEIGNLEGSVNYARQLLRSFDTDRDSEINKQEWISGNEQLKNTFYKEAGLIAIGSGSEGQLADSAIIWRVPDNIPEVPSPIFYKGRIYMIKDGGIITCVNPETGKVLYNTRLGNPGPCLSSPVAANGLIYIFGYNGKLKILKAGDDFQILETHDFKENIAATPAIAGNSIYIRTRTGLMAYSD